MADTYTFAIQGQVINESDADGVEPMAEATLTYRRLSYAQMTEMEDKFFMRPLNELSEMAKAK